jgi:hypothetical protein
MTFCRGVRCGTGVADEVDCRRIRLVSRGLPDSRGPGLTRSLASAQPARHATSARRRTARRMSTRIALLPGPMSNQ